MLDRVAAGRIARKHHTVCRDEAGQLLHEECLTRTGFDGPYTILYHRHRPHTQVVAKVQHGWTLPVAAPERQLAKRHYRSGDLPQQGGPMVNARMPLLFNDDVVLSVAHPTAADPVYFVNGDGDDLFYVFKGRGVLRSQFGDLAYQADDYVCVPRGVLHRWLPDVKEPHVLLSMECAGGLGLLQQWRNEVGQLRMDAPYCHRDFRLSTFAGPQEENIRQLLLKKNGAFHAFEYEHSPLDVLGFDGTVYPWVFPILNFQPRAGLVHLPPTWHGTFSTRGALICSFVPRMVDFHPEAIPCPYPHASVDCDEFLFYSRGNFTSRRGVGPGSISHHPAGIAHGPHPGAYEGSIGHRETSELAVMLDTFKPLHTVATALSVEDPHYQNSFK